MRLRVRIKVTTETVPVAAPLAVTDLDPKKKTFLHSILKIMRLSTLIQFPEIIFYPFLISVK